jgi:4-hydroxybenzoyl-CoA thioesterase/acyl-CoA thioester hydrolase
MTRDTPASESQVFHSQRRVEFRDTDAAGIMHFSNFFTYMEQVEHEFLRSLGLSVMAPQPDGTKLSWPRVAAECQYRAPLRFEQVFDVRLQIRKLGRSSVVFCFEFRLQDQLCAQGTLTTVHCRIGGDEHRPEEIPASLRERMRPYLES